MIDLRKCKKGQKLRLRNGDVVEYVEIDERTTDKNDDYRHLLTNAEFYTHWGQWLEDENHRDVIEIIKDMDTKEKIQDELAAVKNRHNTELEAIQDRLNELDAPRLELKDKHVYRREDGEILFVFKYDCGFNLVNQKSALQHLPSPDKYGVADNWPPIVECIGKIGVVAEDVDLQGGANYGGRSSHSQTFDPNQLTGEKI